MKAIASAWFIGFVAFILTASIAGADESLRALEAVKDAYRALRSGGGQGGFGDDGPRLLSYLPQSSIAVINATTFKAYGLGWQDASRGEDAADPFFADGPVVKAIAPVPDYRTPATRGLFGRFFGRVTASKDGEALASVARAEKEARAVFRRRYRLYREGSGSGDVNVADFLVRSLPREVYATCLKIFSGAYALGYDDAKRGVAPRGAAIFRGYDRKPPKDVRWAGDDGMPSVEACRIR